MRRGSPFSIAAEREWFRRVNERESHMAKEMAWPSKGNKVFTAGRWQEIRLECNPLAIP